MISTRIRCGISALFLGAAAVLQVGCTQTEVPAADDALEVPIDEEGIESQSPNPVEVIVPAPSTCIFSPEELTAAYAGYSDYVAGAAEPDNESAGPGSCAYPHADPDLQYVATPFTIWVTGYSYDDAYIGYRIGADSLIDGDGLPRPGTVIDRSALWALYCPSTDGALCEEASEAGLVVRDNYMAWVFRDDVVWRIEASGITGGRDSDEMGSLLTLAHLAAGRPAS